MAKDAYYFPHFSNARHDRKVKRIVKEFGVEGYGIFFMLLEVLREQTDLTFPVEDIDLLADEFRTSEAKVKTIIGNYGLFEVTNDNRFYSPKQMEYLRPYFEKSERARLAAQKRWHGLPAKGETTGGDQQAKKEAKKEDKKPKAKKGLTKEFVDGVIVKTLGADHLPLMYDWLQYKKDRGEKYKSQQGIKSLCTQMKNMSGGDLKTAEKIVRQSMANNWAGLFRLKQDDVNVAKEEKGNKIPRLDAADLAKYANKV